ncbi:MAG: N-acetyltransferase family protein [Alphaproteobacteria bacterium]
MMRRVTVDVMDIGLPLVGSLRLPSLVSDQPLTRAFPLRRRLRDGSPVRLRMMDARDRERLRDGFEHLSPASRYRRFFTPVPRLTESMLRRLVATDERDHVAVGAEVGGPSFGRRDGLGVARFIRSKERPNEAEMAVAVIDDMQGRGLGVLLLQALCWAARRRGVDRFTAIVLPENDQMRALVRVIDPDAKVRLEDGLRVYDMSVPDIALREIGTGYRRGPVDRVADAGELVLSGVREMLRSLRND